MSEKNTLKTMALENKEFMDKYTKAGLPLNRTMSFPGKKKRTATHSSLSPARQYSKFLRHTGIVYNYREE